MIIVSLVRETGKLIIGTSVLTVVGNAVKATTPATTSKVSKVLVGVGTYVISSVIAEKVTTEIGKEIQSLANGVKDMVKKPEKKE